MECVQTKRERECKKKICHRFCCCCCCYVAVRFLSLSISRSRCIYSRFTFSFVLFIHLKWIFVLTNHRITMITSWINILLLNTVAHSTYGQFISMRFSFQHEVKMVMVVKMPEPWHITVETEEQQKKI